MSDIDLLISLQGDEKVKSKLGEVFQSGQRLRAGFAQGSQAVDNMRQAFDEFSASGTVSISTVGQMASVLPLLLNPVTAVGVGIGAIVAQMIQLRNEAKTLAAEAGAQRMSALMRDAELQIAIRSRAAGTTGLLSAKLRELGMLEREQSNAAKDYTEVLQALAAEEKKTGESRARSMQQATDNYIRGNGARAEHIELLKREVEGLQDYAKGMGEGIAVMDQFVGITEEAVFVSEEFERNIQMLGSTLLGNLGADAFNTYADAVDRVIDGQSAWSASSARAARNAVAGTLRSLGQQAAAQALMELGYAAAGTTAWGAAVYGPPGPHLAAAGYFGSVAAVAGVGAGALSVRPGGSSGGGGGGGAGGGGMVPGRGGPNIAINVIGVLDDAAAGDLARRIRQAIERGDA